MDKSTNDLVSQIALNYILDDENSEEIKKYNNIIAEEIIKLRSPKTTEKYTEYEWRDLYKRSKDNLALKIAMLKAYNLPYEYEKKIVEELPSHLIKCVWESECVHQVSVIKALNLMKKNGINISEIKQDIRSGIIKPTQKVINELCMYNDQENLEYFAFEFLHTGDANDRLNEYRKDKIENEYFWTALANNKWRTPEVRDEAIDNNFILEQIVNLTSNMAETLCKSYLGALSHTPKDSLERYYINERALDKLSEIIKHSKKLCLQENAMLSIIEELKKDRSIKGKKNKNHIFTMMGAYVDSEAVLSKIIDENHIIVRENKYMTEELINKYIDASYSDASNVVENTVAHMILATNKYLSEEFYFEIIDKFQSFDFYRKLFCKEDVNKELMEKMIENITDKEMKQHLCYMRVMKEYLNDSVWMFYQDEIYKIMKYIGCTNKNFENSNFLDEILFHCRTDLKETYLTKEQYNILISAITDLKKLYPDKDEMTDFFKSIVEERYNASKLFNVHKGIFRYTDKEEYETSKGLVMNIETLCRCSNDEKKELLNNIKYETNKETLYIIKDTIKENILDIPEYRLDEIYWKIYKLNDIYYEAEKRYNKIVDKKYKEEISPEDIEL